MMKAIVDIFKDVVYQCLMIYINDIIIYVKIYEEHVIDLKQGLQQLEEQKLCLKESKY